MNALSRIVPYENIEKRHTLFYTSFISQFNYRPLLYMCHSSAKKPKKTRQNKPYLQRQDNCF